MDEFRKVMSERTDCELVKILTIDKDQYQDNAIVAAEEELKKRNLTVGQIEVAKTEIKQKIEEENEKAEEPLGLAWKVLTFIIPGLLNIIFSGAFNADGYHRKAKELRRWTVYRFGFYLLLFLILLITV